ncbi:hypothetical protein JVB16_13825 [Enterobacter hormaechei]|uniref:hypothetical protein n=1 Tax=Enterobacter hormaechei TaxID=158836 RepID=UPI000650C374|nr:hypothetical protein [Enterobacter hormaechei]HCR1986445.1 hypothetical protein [Enterobacter hormaechei subsp. steigerwaltii]KLW08740.1 hypothetical protein SK45_00905 [Enterobacter hormaechei]KLW11356.1 hypothetical protein SK46_02401 [Enterobacter hormaechei]MCM7442773.1 hypothetical protein [Enterobacter hormaechei]MDE7728297.1 hypothetical protein [Enterobacter hormaechei]
MNSDYISYEALISARETAYWAKVSAYGAWFSGVATFLAVITSLFIALINRRAFIGGKVKFGRIMSDDDDRRLIAITVVNRSLHSIKIKAIYWYVGGEIELQQLFRNKESDRLPTRLENGDEANYRIIIDADEDWFKRMAVRLKKLNFHPNKIRCVITLSTGERFRLKVDKRVKEKILQYM